MHLGAASNMSLTEVELLIGCEGFTAYQLQTNSECCKMLFGSEGMGAKVHVRKGKKPGPSAKVPKCMLSWLNEV